MESEGRTVLAFEKEDPTPLDSCFKGDSNALIVASEEVQIRFSVSAVLIPTLRFRVADNDTAFDGLCCQMWL